jgi:hypothetical protein
MHLLDDDYKVQFGTGKKQFSKINSKKEPQSKVIVKKNFVSKNWIEEMMHDENHKAELQRMGSRKKNSNY